MPVFFPLLVAHSTMTCPFGHLAVLADRKRKEGKRKDEDKAKMLTGTFPLASCKSDAWAPQGRGGQGKRWEPSGNRERLIECN
ncbi:hypothetical protein L228DRAFT_180577 [Xylona heveae TC161]|uniref:Uncharacterized protein n=1 Tax=Xylona heveae (strain CBS 132557 / TC161) TaxID=1328760 RepID=A0A165FD72_XYLHT|nr:hypothetical protein L228DRAFT_180577 [Xylona heveae TC161]KZF20847.1 hypothetical protein L228DRAFT_180577 [Xylona heveae TC161]